MKTVLKVGMVLLLTVIFLSGGPLAIAKDDKIKSATEAVSNAAQGAKVDLNTADAAALTQIKGIGPATAENILSYRKEIGKFKSVDDLLQVKGIGPKTLEAIKPFVVVK